MARSSTVVELGRGGGQYPNAGVDVGAITRIVSAAAPDPRRPDTIRRGRIVRDAAVGAGRALSANGQFDAERKKARCGCVSAAPASSPIPACYSM